MSSSEPSLKPKPQSSLGRFCSATFNIINNITQTVLLGNCISAGGMMLFGAETELPYYQAFFFLALVGANTASEYRRLENKPHFTESKTAKDLVSRTKKTSVMLLPMLIKVPVLPLQVACASYLLFRHGEKIATLLKHSNKDINYRALLQNFNQADNSRKIQIALGLNLKLLAHILNNFHTYGFATISALMVFYTNFNAKLPTISCDESVKDNLLFLDAALACVKPSAMSTAPIMPQFHSRESSNTSIVPLVFQLLKNTTSVAPKGLHEIMRAYEKHFPKLELKDAMMQSPHFLTTTDGKVATTIRCFSELLQAQEALTKLVYLSP